MMESYDVLEEGAEPSSPSYAALRKSWPPTSSDCSANETVSTSMNSSVHGYRPLDMMIAPDGLRETYRCQICFETNPVDQQFLLPCNHPFCRECLVGYLSSKITDAQVYPACFYIDENAVETQPATTPDGTANVTKYNTCGKPIPAEVIDTLLSSNPEMHEKYKRFKFAKENKNARECPYCSTWNAVEEAILQTPGGSRVVCTNTACAKEFCFYHSNAHDFALYPTCAEYDAAVAPQQKASVDFIIAVSKPCPGCQVMVMKSGGCNHMKCQCGVAFCWLCGKQIEDSLFPSHFQWWNPSACSNLQMNDATEPSSCQRFAARLLGVFQIIILGPITLASTVTSSLLCCSCIYLKLSMGENGLSWPAIRQFFGTCMSSWGIFWMLLLFFLPAALAAGGVVVAVISAMLIVTYPCYAYQRMHEGHFPWPDFVTAMGRSLCGANCWRRCCGVEATPPPTQFTTLNIDAYEDMESGRDSMSIRVRPPTPRPSLELELTELRMMFGGEDGEAGESGNGGDAQVQEFVALGGVRDGKVGCVNCACRGGDGGGDVEKGGLNALGQLYCVTCTPHGDGGVGSSGISEGVTPTGSNTSGGSDSAKMREILSRVPRGRSGSWLRNGSLHQLSDENLLKASNSSGGGSVGGGGDGSGDQTVKSDAISGSGGNGSGDGGAQNSAVVALESSPADQDQPMKASGGAIE